MFEQFLGRRRGNRQKDLGGAYVQVAYSLKENVHAAVSQPSYHRESSDLGRRSDCVNPNATSSTGASHSSDGEDQSKFRKQIEKRTGPKIVRIEVNWNCQ